MLTDNYETFDENQKKILEKYVTNTSGHVFVLRNLPEVIKGALFSRYSRSKLGLRALLLKEFVTDEAGFDSIVGSDVGGEDQALAIQKAQSFYDRILDGYGDDSIGELGGAHVAIENVSMLAAKALEDSRIGGSPLEKSTRYIYFDEKVGGEYLFYREPVLMTSAFRDLYLDTCNHLFDTYSRLVPMLSEMMEKTFPKDEGTSPGAYKAALRAKVCDCLRGLLPAGTMTNMGIFGNGRFFESLIQKLNCDSLAENQEIGKRMFEELRKVIPSFIRRAELGHRTQLQFAKFDEAIKGDLKRVAEQNQGPERHMEPGTRLIGHDPDAVIKVAAAMLYENSNAGLDDLWNYCRGLGADQLDQILDAGCLARENRRQKSPRALEHASFTFEILTDFGSYRDLHRHRVLTQERQTLSCDYGYYIPPELMGTDCEGPYREAMETAKKAYDAIAAEFPEEAQYVVPMGYHVRWYFHCNLRALQWICELRSSPAGHPTYRHVAQEMARQVCDLIPSFERFFKFVDYEGYDIGRLGQEQRKAEKQQAMGVSS